MKTKITASAPTVHQLTSLSLFGIPYSKHLDGSFTIEKNFDSRDEATDFLKKRAEMYNDQNIDGSEEKLAEMFEDILHGSLRLDAVSAYIDEIED